MTPSTFDRAANTTRLRERSRAAARSVLVDGLSAAQAAKQAGMSRQFVSAAVARVRVAADALVPEGWETVIVTVPPAVAAMVRQMEAEAVEAGSRQV